MFEVRWWGCLEDTKKHAYWTRRRAWGGMMLDRQAGAGGVEPYALCR